MMNVKQRNLGRRRYSIKIYKIFSDCFNFLPVAALIDDRILCMHGGLSPELTSVDQIKQFKRPAEVPDSGLICDLLWSDPNPDQKGNELMIGWNENERGVSYTFG